MPTEFINTYNFVSIPPRPVSGAFGDGRARSFGKVHSDRFSAKLRVRMTTRTPLLLATPHAEPPDPRQSAQRHTTRRDNKGDPLMLGSSLKGALRSAYEAITNSRYGVFDEKMHGRPGSMRVTPQYAAANLFPVWVHEADDDGVTIAGVDVLVPNNFDFRRPEPTSAAVLPRAVANRARNLIPDHPSLDMMEAVAWIRLQYQRIRGHDVVSWVVTDLALADQNLPTDASPLGGGGQSLYDDAVKVRGRVHWTGAPFAGKESERLFVTELLSHSDEIEFRSFETRLDDHLVRGWGAVIDSYVKAHEHEADETRAHQGSYVHTPRAWSLKAGRTMWAKYDEETGEKLISLSPAMIGRRMYEQSAADLVDELHLPATDHQDLSPADRLFGWASADGASTDSEYAAVRGRLSIDQPCLIPEVGKEAIESFDHPVQLAVLNSPKPDQWMFYSLAGDGRKLSDKIGFRRGDRLRGRKFQLPHPDTFNDPGYWSPHGGRAVGDRFKEYLRPAGAPPKLAGEVTDWVVSGVTFETTIHVRDVSALELGALMWLLSRDEDSVLTLGLAKPLGFGATHFSLVEEETHIWSGALLRERYRSLTAAASSPRSATKPDRFVEGFESTVSSTPDLKEAVAEFKHVMTGYPGYPVHTPRKTPTPNPLGYEWWVASRRRVFLPKLKNKAPTLPYNPEPALRGRRY